MMVTSRTSTGPRMVRSGYSHNGVTARTQFSPVSENCVVGVTADSEPTSQWEHFIGHHPSVKMNSDNQGALSELKGPSIEIFGVWAR